VAVGVSTSLIYAPRAVCEDEEMIALAARHALWAVSCPRTCETERLALEPRPTKRSVSGASAHSVEIGTFKIDGKAKWGHMHEQ